MARGSYKKSYRRKARRRTFKRSYKKKIHRKSKLKVRTTKIRNANYLGDRVIVHFRYNNQTVLTQGTVGGGTFVTVPGNYLPTNDTIPTLAQYIALYSSARVIRSKVTVVYTNLEASQSKDVGITQLPMNAAAGVTPTATAMYSQQPRTSSKYLTPLSGSYSRCKMSRIGSIKTAYGNDTPATSRSDVLPTGTMGAAPTEFFLWQIWTQNSVAIAAETTGTELKTQVDYWIEFDQRKQPTV